jgi:hypothetical protein
LGGRLYQELQRFLSFLVGKSLGPQDAKHGEKEHDEIKKALKKFLISLQVNNQSG